MKRLVPFLVLLFILLGCGQSQSYQTNPITDSAMQKTREEMVAQWQPEFEKDGTKMFISGAEKNHLNFISNSLSVDGMFSVTQKEKERYRKLGFTTIYLTGKNGESRALDLTK